ncbi:hypothetical protein L218DRAFT_949053 [Marasmius fiardii PR-910]|nr:hypothetical protein L218DRAFT_949053 [Marasmius fiardii PR-910]
MFPAKVIALFIVSVMMTSTEVVAGPGASTVTQMAFVESAAEDNSKTVHATSVRKSMDLAMIMAAWVSTKFALVERSKGVLVTDSIVVQTFSGKRPELPSSLENVVNTAGCTAELSEVHGFLAALGGIGTLCFRAFEVVRNRVAQSPLRRSFARIPSQQPTITFQLCREILENEL